ncbi:hypothetical protein CBR_g46369 [Chara braunii]|uniref:Uncharacterized protein n=1 Tax=Chara braunii TaxID=69332 RepID=A0A388M0A9_CHABU|nr:hypothetical protein CBR_g46369 [Chara braunii]|eukprot:GBG87998.1 hypothetical protein CBR_g46369 [Chara braunii]
MRTNLKLQDAISEARDRAERRCRRDEVTAKLRITVAYQETETSMDTADLEQVHQDTDSGGESEMSDADRETDLRSWNRPGEIQRHHRAARPVEEGPEASSRQLTPKGRGMGEKQNRGKGPEKGADVGGTREVRPILNGLYFVRERTNALRRNVMAQVLQLLLGKVTLVTVCLVFGDTEPLQNSAKVLVQRPTINEDIIKGNTYGAIEQVAEFRHHSRLESSGDIGETERHDDPLKVPIPHLECGFVSISWLNLDLVISGFEVKLREVLGAA